jgi:hypothetical protein
MRTLRLIAASALVASLGVTSDAYAGNQDTNPTVAAVLMMYDHHHNFWTTAAGAMEKTINSVCGESGEMKCRLMVMYVIKEHRLRG